MTKEEYIKIRISELGSNYQSHTTSKSDWDKIIAMECGDWPNFRGKTSFEFTLKMLLECKYTELDILNALNEEFPNKDNKKRANTVKYAFSGGKCRNVKAYHDNAVIGLKWDRYKLFSPRGEWIIDSETVQTHDDLVDMFHEQVTRSFHDKREARIKRLITAPTKPEAVMIQTMYYPRNPDVVAEVLYKAKGICEGCNKPAPFTRNKDGTPYLEVHHKVILSAGGEDTIENAVALCPNCHRYFHYGATNTFKLDISPQRVSKE